MNKRRPFVFFLLFLTLCSFYPHKIKIRSSSKTIINLIIVAHPDDESIFAGNEILNNTYYIVCITNGNNPIRKKEFEKMLIATNNTGTLLSYPDKTNGERNDWSTISNEIEKDLSAIIASNKWDKIVTHNPQGEYGHIQHKRTNELVTNVVKQQNLQEKLYYFAPYFQAIDEPEHTKVLTADEISAKIKLLAIYSSQSKIIKKLYHILDYEELSPYQENP